MRIRGHGRRLGISELIATLIMIAVTLVAGTAAFGWILLQAGSSENSYGNSVANNVNFLNERFTLVSSAFSNYPSGACPGSPGACINASFWLYNTGSVDFTLFSIQARNITNTPAGNCPGTHGCYVNVIFSKNTVTAYQPAGTIYAGCTDTSLTGGFFGGASPLGQGKLTRTPFKISMPSCPGPGQLILYDGTTYSVVLTGLYGNVVTQSITPNG